MYSKYKAHKFFQMAKFIEVKSKGFSLIIINIELIEYFYQNDDGSVTVSFPTGWLELLYSKEEF